jgi:hypothetical protein
MKRTLQPRYTVRALPENADKANRRASTKKAKANAGGEGTTASSPPGSRGTGGGMAGERRGIKWGSSSSPPQGNRKAKTRRTKTISRRERGRVSDEAIVSRDPGGQHNLRGSQGPLDRTRPETTTCTAGKPVLPNGLERAEIRGLAAYKFRSDRGMRVPRLSREHLSEGHGRKPGLKPYWGKPDVRNFRGGAGNVVHGSEAFRHETGNGGHGEPQPKHARACTPLGGCHCLVAAWPR